MSKPPDLRVVNADGRARAAPLPLRILIADDERDTASVLAAILRDEGHEAHMVLRGDEVLEMDRLLRPDVVILDINMPGGSGIEVLHDIKQLSPSPRVIMLTNYSQPQYRRKCLDAGADHFFDKSTEFEKIRDVLVAGTRA